MDSKVTGALGAAAPYALIAGLGFLALKLFEGIAPAAGAAAGGAVGGAFGGVLRGVGEGLGLAPNVSEPVISAIIGGNESGQQTAAIIIPANNGTVMRKGFDFNYAVRANITWPREQAVLVTFDAQEFPRGGGERGASRKVASMKLITGRNLVDVSMPVTTGQCDVVLGLSVDGKQYDSKAFYVV